MRQRRQLAPWQRNHLKINALELDDPKVAEALAALEGKPAIYHCLSRVVNRDRVFRRHERDMFVKLMRRYEAFCQVGVWTHCVMSNHFHILVEVPAPPEDRGASWSDERLLSHLEIIYSQSKVAELRWELARMRRLRDEAAAEEFRNRYFRRMWDLSEFLKIVKQSFSQWFNRRHERRGVLWEGRFQSELVEDGHAARRVATYIDLNPVRAGLVDDPKDWRWSGYGEAVAGVVAARRGLQRILLEKAKTQVGKGLASEEAADGHQILRNYRMALFTDGKEHPRDARKNRVGIAGARVKNVLENGGRLSEADLLSCKTRYFIDAIVIGGEGFVDHVFELIRGSLGDRRTTGARRMRRVSSKLRTLRDLQKDALVYQGGAGA